MAQKQISRITHRRGPLVDLSGVTLNTGELGWAIDERRLFIGNRIEDGGPEDDNIEILTEFSSTPYEYIEGITGERLTNARLRDRASIFDFGLEKTDSASSQTLVFQEAADRLYNPLFAGTIPYDNASIFLPAFTYTVDSANYSTDGTTATSGIRLYPGMTLIGENPANTIISSTSSVSSIAETANQTGGTGTNLITSTGNIVVANITFRLDSGPISPVVLLRNSSNIIFYNCRFVGTGSTTKAIDWTRGTTTDELGDASFINCEFSGFASIVDVTDASLLINRLNFDRCKFSNSTAGLVVRDGVRNFQVSNSQFSNITNICLDIQTTDESGHVSSFNEYSGSGTGINFASGSFENVSLMDRFETVTTHIAWNGAIRNIALGPQENYGIGNGLPSLVNMSTVDSVTTFLTVATANLSVFEFKYSLTQNSVERVGTFRVITDGTNVSYDDDFIETGGATTLTLSAEISGSDIQFRYNAVTNTAVFYYRLSTWLN